MKNLENYKAINEFISSWLKVGTVIMAAFFSITEYLEHKESEQVKLTLKYVERYNSNKMLDMRTQLSLKLDEENKALISTLSDSSLSADELNKKYSQLILQIIEKHKLAVNLKTLIGFHEEVVLCVDSTLCNEQVAKDFFTIDAQELFRGFYPYICEERRKWKNNRIGQRIEAFYNKSDGNACSA